MPEREPKPWLVRRKWREYEPPKRFFEPEPAPLDAVDQATLEENPLTLVPVLAWLSSPYQFNLLDPEAQHYIRSATARLLEQHASTPDMEGIVAALGDSSETTAAMRSPELDLETLPTLGKLGKYITEVWHQRTSNGDRDIPHRP